MMYVCMYLFMSPLERDEMVRSPTTYEMQHMPAYLLGPSLYNGGGVAKTIRLDTDMVVNHRVVKGMAKHESLEFKRRGVQSNQLCGGCRLTLL